MRRRFIPFIQQFLGLRPHTWQRTPAILTAVASLVTAATQVWAASGDSWLEDKTAVYPSAFKKIDDKAFSSLHAESLVGKLKVYLDSNALLAGTPVLHASFDAPGRWRARYWRRFPMEPRGPRFEAELPAESVDVLVVYFVEAQLGGITNASPMRVCSPRDLGLEKPSREPWTFIEGFELGLDGWAIAGDAPPGAVLSAANQGHDGEHSLSVSMPERARSITVVTTRLRGWKILQHHAIGLRVWACAVSGTGVAKLTLVANARTDKQAVFAFPEEFKLNEGWSKMEIPLSRIPDLLQGEIDLMTIEFVGTGPVVFQLDDLELVGLLREGPVPGN